MAWALTMIAPALALVAPTVAAQDGTEIFTPPYDASMTTGVATADPATGEVAVYGVAPATSLLDTEAGFTMTHHLVSAVTSVEYTVTATVDSGNYVLWGGSLLYVFPIENYRDPNDYIQAGIDLVGKATHPACPQCEASGRVNLQDVQGGDVDGTIEQDVAHEVTLTFVLANVTGGLVPAGDVEIFVGFDSYSSGAAGIPYLSPTSGVAHVYYGAGASEFHGTIRSIAVRASTGPVLLPDLQIVSVGVSPGASEENPPTLQVVVKNEGSATALQSYVSLRSLSPSPETFEHILAGGALGAGQSTILEAPGGFAAGSYTVEAMADPYDRVGESIETNNLARLTYEIAPQVHFPDVIVSGLTTTPAPYQAGDDVTFIASVKNIGYKAASGLRVDFYVDGNWVGYNFGPDVQPGASVEVDSDWFTWRATSGDHSVLVTVSMPESQRESDTSNNGATFQIRDGPVVRGVDLSPRDQQQTVRPQATATYSITVTNTGNTEDMILLSTTGSKHGWVVSLDQSSMILGPGQSAIVQLTVKAGNAGNLVVSVTGTSQGDPSMKGTATCRTQVSK